MVAATAGDGRNDGDRPKRVRAERHCSRCDETGHNSRTCKVEIEDVDGNDASEEQYLITYSLKFCCGVARRRCVGVLVGRSGRLGGETR